MGSLTLPRKNRSPAFDDVQVLIGDVECQIVYAGAAPGLVHGVGGVSSQPGVTVAIS